MIEQGWHIEVRQRLLKHSAVTTRSVAVAVAMVVETGPARSVRGGGSAPGVRVGIMYYLRRPGGNVTAPELQGTGSSLSSNRLGEPRQAVAAV